MAKPGVLSKEDVLVINERLLAKERGAAIARDFEVSQQSISAIKTGESWGHVTGRGTKQPASPERMNTKSAVLTVAQVREIADRLDGGARQTVLAEEYNVSTQTIYSIKSGLAWGWLTGREYNPRPYSKRSNS